MDRHHHSPWSGEPPSMAVPFADRGGGGDRYQWPTDPLGGRAIWTDRPTNQHPPRSTNKRHVLQQSHEPSSNFAYDDAGIMPNQPNHRTELPVTIFGFLSSFIDRRNGMKSFIAVDLRWEETIAIVTQHNSQRPPFFCRHIQQPGWYHQSSSQQQTTASSWSWRYQRHKPDRR